jgi:hypothetical protein
MVMAGMKFAIGFWLGTVALVMLVTLLRSLASCVGRYLDKLRKRRPKADRSRARDMLWTRGLKFAPHEDASFQAFSFRTMVTWRDRDHRAGRRKEPQYRQ